MLESEEGKVGRDDNDGGEEDGTCHFVGALLDIVGGKLEFGVAFSFFEDVFHHDDGTVDEDAEVDGTKREEVGGDASEFHEHEGDEEGNWDGDGHNEGAAEVAEENHEYHDDEEHADEQGVGDGFEGFADEVGSVEEGVDFDPFG